MKPADYLQAARVPHSVLPQTFGLWTIERRLASDSILGELDLVGWHDYTLLRRVSMKSLHLDVGEVVMEDSRRELQKHLPIWLAARGRVLITGLGLGCVVRGLLANPAVEHIDVVEIDGGVLRVIGAEFRDSKRVNLIHGDALTIDLPGRWDCAWHDIWTDGDVHLQLLHGKLIRRFWPRVGKQGAWAFPRIATRRTPIRLLGAPKPKGVLAQWMADYGVSKS